MMMLMIVAFNVNITVVVAAALAVHLGAEDGGFLVRALLDVRVGLPEQVRARVLTVVRLNGVLQRGGLP